MARQTRKRFRLFRFSLAGMLTVFTIFSVWLGSLANKAFQQQRAVLAITRAGGNVFYDTHETNVWRQVRANQVAAAQKSGIAFNKAKPPGPMAIPDGLLSEAQLDRRDFIRRYFGEQVADNHVHGRRDGSGLSHP